jgi:hypothetical protein
MNIADHLDRFDEREQRQKEDREKALRDEEQRKRLNLERVSQNLSKVVEPKLVEAAHVIKSKKHYAAVEIARSTDGSVVYSIILKTSRFQDASESSMFKLEYRGEENSAIIKAHIRIPDASGSPFIDLGTFELDAITPEDVEGHLGTLVKKAFP